jgi:hypothetical protein
VAVVFVVQIARVDLLGIASDGGFSDHNVFVPAIFAKNKTFDTQLHQINFISTNIITRISTQTIMIYESNEMSLPRPLYLMSLHLRDLDSSL